MTNHERIKAKTAEEMAEGIIDTGNPCEYCAYDSYTCENDCKYGIVKWLESEEE